jgi:hypothetical protein
MTYCVGVINMEDKDSQRYIQLPSPLSVNKNIFNYLKISVRRQVYKTSAEARLSEYVG